MIYSFKAQITCDTRTNKVIIETGSNPDLKKRLVLFPAKKLAEHWIDVSINDRPAGPFSYAKDVCKVIAQELHGRPERKEILKDLGPPNTGFSDGG